LIIADTGWIGALPVQRLGRATYLRLALPGVLGDRYRRILYLDSDIVFEGGDLNRLLDLPMGDHAIAAVCDIGPFYKSGWHAPEYKILGLPPLPYFNAGFQLIDCEAYRSQRIFQRCLDLARDHPEACIKHDQSLLNGVLRGRFARLAQSWNWQSTEHLPYATLRYPVRFRHFVGPIKPWNDPHGLCDPRFRAAYLDMFRVFFPEALDRIIAGPNPTLMDMNWLVRRLRFHYRKRKLIAAQLDEFTDEWDVKL